MKHPVKSGINRLGGVIDDRDHLAAYLLGELPDEEQVALERDYLVDDGAYERLLVVEDELAYDYADGRLSPRQRSRFESTVGATQRGQKNVEFARALLDALRSSQRALGRPGRYWAMGIAAALALAVLPAWLAFRVRGLTVQLAGVRSEMAATQSRLEREVADRRSAPAPVAVPVEAAFLLTPGLARGEGGPPRLELSPLADTIRFELVPPPGAEPGQYAIAIRTTQGAQVWSQSGALAGRIWIVHAPAKLFVSGAYELAVRRLTAGEQPAELAAYPFVFLHK